MSAARLPVRAFAAVAALAFVLLALALAVTGGAARPVASPAPPSTEPYAPLPLEGAPALTGAEGHALSRAGAADPLPRVPDPGGPPSLTTDSAVPALHSSGTHPSADEAWLAAGTVLLRPQRDTGERAVPTGAWLRTPAYTPRVPAGPVSAAPPSGHAPPAAAHPPSDPQRAPPSHSSV